jgi:hypothetical protein
MMTRSKDSPSASRFRTLSVPEKIVVTWYPEVFSNCLTSSR